MFKCTLSKTCFSSKKVNKSMCMFSYTITHGIRDPEFNSTIGHNRKSKHISAKLFGGYSYLSKTTQISQTNQKSWVTGGASF